MKPISLLIENFYCHKKSFIDFNDFTSACVVGQAENNDQRANGIGKSKIFTAITYALFNKTSLKNIENCIRHGSDKCRVTFVFESESVVWKIIRSRPRKGAAELLLLEQNGDEWISKDERTSSQTEKEIFKIIKMNYETFRNSALFAQHDLEGIATATPTARKELLRETLQLQNYKKLEDITKKRTVALVKQQEKQKAILGTFNNISSLIMSLTNDISSVDPLILQVTELILNKKEEIKTFVEEISSDAQNILDFKSKIENIDRDLKTCQENISNLTGKKEALVLKLKKIKVETEQSINELSGKNLEIDRLQSLPSCASNLDEEIISLTNEINEIKNKLNVNLYQIKELEKPLPHGPSCDHCQQILSDEYRYEFEKKALEKYQKLEEQRKLFDLAISGSNVKLQNLKKAKDAEFLKNKKIDELKNQVLFIDKEISKSKNYFQDYQNDLGVAKKDLVSAQEMLSKLSTERSVFNTDEFDKQCNKLQANKKSLNIMNSGLGTMETSRAELALKKKIAEDRLEQAIQRQIQEAALIKEVSETEAMINNHQLVSQAFGSKGIPTLIIHNMLDDFQVEANNIISQLKPGIQLKFEIDKENSKGEQTDTLDIIYYKDGREHEWGMLSGGQQFSIMLSLRFALSLVIQKNYGIDIKFLLLDEIDGSLDKETLDLLFEMIKIIETDFKVLMITHNDSLKSRFTHAVMVEMDQDLNSTAKVISW